MLQEIRKLYVRNNCKWTKFRIKGDQPTPKEQLAIDTFYLDKNKKELLISIQKMN